MIDEPSQHEAQVGKAVQVAKDDRVHSLDMRQFHAATFRASCHRAGEVQHRGGRSASGKDEPVKRLEAGLAPVDIRLERLNGVLRERGNSQCGPVFSLRNRQLGADSEKLILYSFQDFVQGFREGMAAHDT